MILYHKGNILKQILKDEAYMDYDSLFLNNNGFELSVPMSRLMTDSDSRKELPKIKGVYIVASKDLMKKGFLEKGTGGFFEGKDPNVSIEVLNLNWVQNSRIFYIGKAGGFHKSGKPLKSTLKSRITDMARFGNGHRAPHSGGRYLWQLAFSKELLVYFKTCSENEEPRKIEEDLRTR